MLLSGIGHALGLEDPRSGNVGLDIALAHQGRTAMSALSAPRSELLAVTGSSATGWVETYGFISASKLMLYDIQALQYLYGANTATRAGNTAYSWDTSAEFFQTLWDGGGQDTINASNQVFKCVINLNAGQFSSIGLRVGEAQIRQGLGIPSGYDQPLPADLYDGSNNLAIAQGVVIENATGGRGADTITGNGVANTLRGNAGNDTLSGSGGDDILDGGAGNDRLVGGGGIDTAFYAQALAGVQVNLASTAAQATGGAGRDTLSAIENLAGSSFADRLSGSDAANVLRGLGGNDLLIAGNGVDRLQGGAGSDVFDYDAVAQSGGTAATRDVILDFVAGQDKINLYTIDARPHTAADDAFVFIGSRAFSATDATGQVRFADGVLYASTDADAAAELSIALTGVTSLRAADLVL